MSEQKNHQPRRLELVAFLVGMVALLTSGYALFSMRGDTPTATPNAPRIVSASNHIGGPQCQNNSGEVCPSQPSINFYPPGNEGAPTSATINPDFAYNSPTGNGRQREISGRISQVTGNTVTLKTLEGSAYTVTFPVDAISQFNSQYAHSYNASPSFQVGPGSMLDVIYYDPDYFAADVSNHIIKANQIIRSVVLIKISDYKADPQAPVELY